MHATTITRMRTRRALVALAVAGVCGAGAIAVHAAPATAANSVPRCRLRQLWLAPPKSNGAAGSIRLRFVFTNTSPTTCKLFGFPGMQMLNKHHAAIHTQVIRGTSNVVPPEPEKTVVMTSGQHGSFYAGYSDVPTGTQVCRTSALVEVTPPNALKHFTLPLRITPCGGKITVSPVVHGRLPV